MTGCQLNQIFLGEVASVQNYGAFVKIPGCAQQGLIHRTQVSSVHIDDVGEVLQRGERVWCKVINVGEDKKIGLSMKYVDQGKGTDLDPNGVQLQQDLQKKKTVGNTQRKTIQLEAVFNTTCTKCGTHGHLATNCFMSPDGKKYELIPEVESEKVAEVQIEVKEQKEGKKHKEKKSKKRKKSKKSKHSTDSSESEEVIKKRKKKHSKDKKRKRKKSMDASDDSASGDNSKSTKRKLSESTETKAKKCKHSKTKHSD